MARTFDALKHILVIRHYNFLFSFLAYNYTIYVRDYFKQTAALSRLRNALTTTPNSPVNRYYLYATTDIHAKILVMPGTLLG